MQTLESIYQQLDLIRIRKKMMVNAQLYEESAALRKTEKDLIQEADSYEKQHKLTLSKSKYVRGLQCEKSLWLYVHKYKEQTFSNAQEALFQQGSDVGVMARALLPNGVLAVADGSYPGFASAAYTQSLIDKGVTTIYEATFVHDNIIVAVDMLDFRDGQWNAFEVKSTTKVKDTHYTDAAIQYYVLSAHLQNIEMYIVHFNRDYIRMGPLNLRKLFTAAKITAHVQNMQADIPQKTRELKLNILGAEPVKEVGAHCNTPYTCSFYAYCHKDIPEEPEVTVPMEEGETYINVEAVQEYVQMTDYPIGYLDFESIMPAVPMFDQSRPYQQIVFQYSLHWQLTADSAPEHAEMLASNEGDPRLQIIPSLIAHAAQLETILVYNASFERSRLEEMAEDFPQYATALNDITYKLLDLMPVFRVWYRTHSMGARYSMKVVLPALCPDLNYDQLPIGDGVSATNAFMQLYHEKDEAKKAAIRQSLIEYCTLDTYGMMRLWALLKVV
jgi:hypothetical protein